MSFFHWPPGHYFWFSRIGTPFQSEISMLGERFLQEFHANAINILFSITPYFLAILSVFWYFLMTFWHFLMIFDTLEPWGRVWKGCVGRYHKVVTSTYCRFSNGQTFKCSAISFWRWIKRRVSPIGLLTIRWVLSRTKRKAWLSTISFGNILSDTLLIAKQWSNSLEHSLNFMSLKKLKTFETISIKVTAIALLITLLNHHDTHALAIASCGMANTQAWKTVSVYCIFQ